MIAWRTPKNACGEGYPFHGISGNKVNARTRVSWHQKPNKNITFIQVNKQLVFPCGSSEDGIYWPQSQASKINYYRPAMLAPPCEQSGFFCLLLDRGGEKETPRQQSRQTFDVTAARTFGIVNLVFSRQTGFLSASIRLLINRCSYSSPLCSARLLGLGLKLYPSNILDLTRLMQSLCRVR